MNKFIFITLFLVENVFSVCLAQSYPYQKESIPVPQRVKDLLSRMTLEEKIAELNLIPYYTKDDSICRSLIRAGKVGAFLKANGAELNRSLQEEALKHSRLGIPLIFHEDVIHGYRTITPIPLAESCSWNPELVEQSAAMAAREAAAAGIQLTYAPMVDISYDPRWGRIMETSGEDAYLCGELAAARVRGFQGNDLTSPHTIAACVKHFAADDVLERINVQGVENLIDFCMNHQLSMTNLLLLGIRTYLSKVNNGQEDITIQNFISRRSTHDEWTSGGSRTIMFPCRTVITPETDFLSAAYEIQNMQNRIYMHSNYDPAFIMDEMRKRYNTPEHTGYESCYLTYQPMTVKVENEMLGTIRQHAKWFANGAATKKMYLTVSHTEDGGMNFSYHYQTAHLEEHDMELLYYYMMRILFKGIAEPDMSIGEIMELV